MAKSKSLKKHVEEAAQMLLEAEERLKAAQEEELQVIEDCTAGINALCDESNLFCGIILTKADIIQLVDMALTTGESIKIGYRLYLND
jgi:hypothetical protein